jgi:hypothetical protein
MIQIYNNTNIDKAVIMLLLRTKGQCSEQQMLSFKDKSIVKIGNTLHIYDPYNILNNN